MTAPSPNPDRIDPGKAWQPWRPGPGDPWCRKWAAHLYRRAAFGANRQELHEAERLGLDGTLALLLHGRPEAAETLPTLVDVGRVAASRDEGGVLLRGWWVYCMLQGGHPLREKMTLFWHNHFATSLNKVQDATLMFRQNCLLREGALGKFGPLLQAVSKDGAMLLWLDSNSNAKEHPNENYARELMELFSLGVGNYSEKDVREAARAFTGWHTDGKGFRLNAAAHDDGFKTVLKQTGNWDGDDVVRIILDQPRAARFLVRKLYQFFIGDVVPSDSFLEPLSDAFRQSDYDIAALVRTILASRHFYSARAFRQRVKSPVEYVLGAVRAIYRAYDEREQDYRPLPPQTLASRIASMGQELFAPPNVKGWPGGRSWLNTATVLERDNFAEALATGALWSIPPPTAVAAVSAFPATSVAAFRPVVPSGSTPSPELLAPPRALDAARVLDEEGANRPEDVVRVLLDLYLPGGIRPETRAKLIAFVAGDNPVGPAPRQRVREAVQAILTLAEYQLA